MPTGTPPGSSGYEDTAQQPNEQHSEHPTVQVLLIPSDVTAPMRLTRIRRGVADYQAAIGGGWLQAHVLSEAACMYFDEEGKYKGLAPNLRATLIAEKAHPGFTARDYVSGDVFLTGPVDEDGYDTDLADDWHRHGLPVATEATLQVQVG